jgi:hypothetical protein
MLTLTMSWMLGLCMAAAPAGIPPSSQLVYRGSVTPVAEGGEPEKTFDLTFWMSGTQVNEPAVEWLLQERGQGAWPWFGQFGRMKLSPEGTMPSEGLPRLWYDRAAEGVSAVSFALPLSALGRELQTGSEWTDERGTFIVASVEDVEGRPTWRVELRTLQGSKGTLWIDKEFGAARRMEQTVFMGMGVEYKVEMHLATYEELPADRRNAIADHVERLTALKTRLAPRMDPVPSPWSAEERQWIVEQLPQLREGIADGPLARVVRAIERDVETQSRRAAGVAALEDARLNQPAPAFELAGLDDARLTSDSLADGVTILHFWDYRDSPLLEPYGQVGYLDFLFGRRKEEGLLVYGVAVDGRLAEEAARGGVMRSVRRLRSFMNLSYPILLDEGAILEKFGDPRTVGAELPLFIVVDRDGKVVHYHAGYYETEPDQGLRELDRVVEQALARERTKGCP